MTKGSKIAAPFWTNPLRDTSDPNLHRVICTARAELKGWEEKDATRLLYRARQFCSRFRMTGLDVQNQCLAIGESEMRIGSDDLLLLIYLFRNPEKYGKSKLWCSPDSNRTVLAVLVLWHAKQRDMHAARRAIFLAGELLAPDATRGKKVLDGVLTAHRIAHGNEQEKIKKWNSYQLEVNQLHSQHPRWSYSEIKRHAAKTFNVSDKTIQRHTVNPIKES